jgi:hypothetical protein
VFRRTLLARAVAFRGFAWLISEWEGELVTSVKNAFSNAAVVQSGVRVGAAVETETGMYGATT